MINKIFFLIIILVGGFAFLVTLAGYNMVQMDKTMANDPCGFSANYSSVNTYTTTTGLAPGSYVTTETTSTQSIPGASEITSTGGNLYCYIKNIGAYSNSISHAFGLPEVVIDILNIIFSIIIVIGIFWLIYYIVSAFSGVVG